MKFRIMFNSWGREKGCGGILWDSRCNDCSVSNLGDGYADVCFIVLYNFLKV